MTLFNPEMEWCVADGIYIFEDPGFEGICEGAGGCEGGRRWRTETVVFLHGAVGGG